MPITKESVEARAAGQRRQRSRPGPEEDGYTSSARVRVSRQELERLYYDEELSYAGVASRLGCSRPCVAKLMRKWGIRPRSQSVARRVGMRHGRVVYPVLPEEERLERQRASAIRSQARYRKKHPKRTRAHWRVQKAVQRGTLERPEACSRCGASCKPEAHHPDYDKPLEVEWLCRKCHRRVHRSASERRRQRDQYIS